MSKMCSSSSGGSDGEVEEIQITHIINPHQFWFTYKNKPNANVHAIEEDLDKYAKEKGDEQRADRTNGKYRSETVVAVYLLSKEKWIRAEVVQVKQFEIILWAIDYGYPLETTTDLVLVLNNDLKRICFTTPSNVIKGGIYAIMPATMKMSLSNQLRSLQAEKWDPKVIEHFNSMKSHQGMTMYFKPIFDTNDHVFGTLKLQNNEKGIIKSVAEIFQGMKKAIELPPAKFERDIVSSELIKISRWLDNNGDLDCLDNKNDEEILSGSSNVTNVKVIDQQKLLQRFSRMQIMATSDNMSRLSANTSESNEPESSYSQSNSQQTTQVNSGRAKLEECVKRLEIQNLSKLSPKIAQNSPLIARPLTSDFLRLSLAQTDEPGLVNKVKSTPIFIRNNDEEPIETIKRANFTDAVHRGMKIMNCQETYVSQGYAWPNLLRGNSLVLVNSKNTGKTLAYLPALCSLVQQNYDEAMKIKDGRNRPRLEAGATAIIVCLTSSVSKMAEQCRKILQMRQFESNVVEAIGTRDAVNVTVKLYNGSNILVSTAPCLMELIKKSPQVIKGDKLKCVAFENLDCIMEKHPDICKDIIKELCLRKSYKGDQRQFVVTSRTWKPILFNFMNEKLIADSVLIIGNHLEAAFSAGVVLNFRLSLNDAKFIDLMGDLRAIPIREERTMILCNEMSEAEQLAKFLESNHISYHLIKEISSNYSKSRTKSFWDNMEGVLICTDEHLADTQIRNAQHILHFSVNPDQYKPFLYRFSALLEFIASEKNAKKASSYVFIDNSNFKQLPKLVTLLTRDGQSIPERLLELSQQARITIRKEKAEKQRLQPICNFVFMHAINEHQADCRYRHLILGSDILDDAVNQITSGQLRFKVLKVISPTEYIVQPINHAAALDCMGNFGKWQTVNKSNEFDQFNSQMQAHYKNSANQKVLSTLELGQKCVILLREIFYRAEIIQIIEKRNITDTDKYQVRLIDTGVIEYDMHAFELFALEEQFQTIPGQAYHLHLTSIIPADKEDDWDPRVCEQIRKHLNEMMAKEDDLIYEANVLFSLRDAIVVNIMRLINVKRGIVHCAIKSYLQNKQYGISSKPSMKKVIEMAKSEGIKIKLTKTQENVVNTTSSAARPKLKANDGNSSTNDHVESNAESSSIADSASESALQEENEEKWSSPWKFQHQQIQISQFNDPSHFYVNPLNGRLEELYKAIDKYVEENIEPSLDRSMCEPDVFKYCLVKIDDGFNRAKVLEVLYSTGDDVQLNVFLVDIGLMKEVNVLNAYDIPDNLIQMYPFQAIWCNLVGIKPIKMNDDDPCWTEDQIDKIYNAIDGHELILHTVSSNRFVKSPVPDTKILRYDVVLLAINDTEQIIINEMLVTQQLAEFDSSTKHQLENIPILLEEDDDSDNESNWDDEFDSNNSWEMVSNAAPSQVKTPTSDMGSVDFEYVKQLLTDDTLENDVNDFLQALGNQNGPQPLESNAKPNDFDKEQKRDNGYVSEENNDTNGITSESCGDDKSEDSVKDAEDLKTHHQLEYVYRRPHVYWWQTDDLMVLKITAHDGVSYGLEVTTDQLIYSTVENEEQIVAIIQFFGCVDSKKIIHDVRGVNVVIRLRKLCPIKWPRLRATAEKCTWIMQNIDAVKDEDFYPHTANLTENMGPSSESDDEESEDNNINRNRIEDDERSFDEDVSDDIPFS